jgi:hypothetical protein
MKDCLLSLLVSRRDKKVEKDAILDVLCGDMSVS